MMHSTVPTVVAGAAVAAVGQLDPDEPEIGRRSPLGHVGFAAIEPEIG
jgi:hypothetical protein